MRQVIQVPYLGESIQEVTLVRWLQEEGSWVEREEEIAEIETAKANQPLYATQSGRLTHLIQAGAVLSIGDSIGAIESETTPLDSTQSLRSTEQAIAVPSLTPPLEPSVKETLVGKNRKRLSPLRQQIAHRLVDSLHSMAPTTTFNEIDMTALLQFRREHKEPWLREFGIQLGIVSFFIKAVGKALLQYPILNSFLDGEELVEREGVHIGVAVGTDRGVVVPVLRHVNQLSIQNIEEQLSILVAKIESKTIAIGDLDGAGFTISNGGVYGSLFSAPLIPPKQVGVLGLHTIQERPVVVQGEIVIRPMMYVALSYDHRVLDGKEAIAFLNTVKVQIEQEIIAICDSP